MLHYKFYNGTLTKWKCLLKVELQSECQIFVRQFSSPIFNLFPPSRYHKCNRLTSLKLLYAFNKRTLTSGTAILRFLNNTSDNIANISQQNESIDEFTGRMYHHPGMGHNILLIQPRNKYGPNWEKKNVSEVKLEEAVALVNTLPGWKVIEKCVLPASLDSPLLFGKGNLEYIKSIIHLNHRISALFVGIDIMTSLQNSKLEKFFGIQVFDRYQVILQIFYDHAHTKEAKLQLALAEIPYLRVKLCSFSHTGNTNTFQGMEKVGGDGENFMQVRKRLLNERELKLKKELEKIKNQRELLRRSDHRNLLPVVAIVGYTNCGKTTLIKSLTNDSKLVPEDKLFATLDVTLHSGLLPSQQKVLFIDTVGFISDVPTSLIQSFRSTLEEINLADLVVHVRDISHPNTETQKATVLQTLKELHLPPKLLDTVVEVRNKIDLLEDSEILQRDESDAVCISATDGTGLPDLMEIIEQKLFENTGHNVTLIRIPNGGPEYSWLLREAAIRDAMADTKDENFLIVEVVITSANLAKFKHLFGDLTISIESISQ